MAKIFNKIIAIILTLIIVGVNFDAIGVYASSELQQNTNTTEENVQFNATVDNLYSVKADISSELKLNLTIKVSNTGYLKDATITLNNNNYQIVQNTNLNVKSINENVIELNQVNAGEILSIELPIKLNKTELVNIDEFNKDSEVVLNATYVNESGKEKKVEKKFTEHIEWTANATEKIEQALIRYLKYDTNKTMVSFKVKEGISEDLIPETSKEIKINVPQIAESNPSKVIVTGEGIEYSYENGLLTISKKNEVNSDGKIKWNSQDEYIVTYLYDAVSNQEKITSDAVATATTIKGDTLEAKTENNDYVTKSEIGTIIETEISGTSEACKGYMYTNLNNGENKLETLFESNYKINIANKDLTDKIMLTENTYKFDEIDANDSIIDKKVRINKDEIIKILGEDGRILVKNTNGEELGTLNKDVLELQVNTNRLILETSKPQTEGNLNIIVEKAIKGESNYSKNQIKEFKEIMENINVQDYKENVINSTEALTKNIKLTEPKSNASLEISTNTLSTVVENKDVVINAILKTKDINDALYTDPTIKITLPKEVTNIELTDAKLIYEDELVSTSFKTNGNEIILTLQGTQTKYATQSVSDGTVLRIVANLTLDNLAPTTTENVSMEYTNSATGEDNVITKEVSIIAPTGFVTINNATIDGQTETSQENEGNSIKIATGANSKKLELQGTIVNNLGNDADGVTILGRIPFKGNKTIQGTDLDSTIDTTLANAISVSGLDNATIYYSTNGEETINGTSWTTEYNENSKSYKIVANQKVANKTKIVFNYSVTVPENLTYGNKAKAIYGVYYNNNATEGASQNLIEAKSVGITTGEIPKISTSITAVDTNEGYAIEDNGNITEGEYITYKVKVSNTGKEDATNVNVIEKLPGGLSVVNLNTPSLGDAPTYSIDKVTKEVTKKIETLKAESEQTVEFTVACTQIISNIELGKDLRIWTKDDTENAKKLITNFTISSDKLEENINKSFTVKNNEGYLHTNLTSNVSEQIENGQSISYRISIKNVNNVEKNNVIVKLQLPKEIEYVGTKYQTSYDKTSNVVTCNIEKIEKNSSYSLMMEAKVIKDSDSSIKTVATVTCDETSDKMKSNTITYDFKNTKISTKQTTNIEGNGLLDTDELEFYIDIKNEGNKEETLVFKDIIPSELKVKSYVLSVDGKEIYRGSTAFITTSFNLPAGKSARATITTGVNMVEKGKTINIENNPIILLSTGNEINVDTAKFAITGTGTVSSNETGNNGNTGNNEDTIGTAEGTYKVSGTAWFDANMNGKKESDEEKLSGIKISLYEKDTNSIAKDLYEKELTLTTNSEGKYTFTNVKPGNYIAIAEFDNEKYDLTTYKLDELSISEDSDFINVKLNDKNVAATDTISVTNSNTYNIDLGLTTKKKFDLSLNKTITRITITNTKTKTKIYDYDNKNIAKVELSNNYVEYATVLVEYTIKITNEGQVAGYAKSIVDYIPEGMEFNSELNNNWYKDKEGNGYNTSLANTIIEPGETKEIKLVLSRKMTGENTGTVRNTAEILTSYNEMGLEDIDSKAGNKQDGEDDMSSADVIIAMGTGKEVASITGIALGILSLIALTVYEIKKHVINKMYTL